MTKNDLKDLHAGWLATFAIPAGIDERSRRIREDGPVDRAVQPLSSASVALLRRKLGIERFSRSKLKPEWIALLGQVPDRLISQELGVSKQLVSAKRRELGISPLSPVTWTADILARLGREPDRRIAEAMGVSDTTVGNKRRACGIPRHSPGG